MISKTEISIGGRTIEIHRCAATEALDLELSIARVAGNVDISAITAAGAGKLAEAVALGGLVDVVGGIAKNLTHAELMRLMNMQFQYVRIDGKPFRDINEDFSDRPKDIWEVFIAAIKHNLGPLGEGLLQKSQPASQRPTT
jgi:hypothetical protein